ncbi:hypothetical protein CK203_117229 [Vitis vinifera]|uniref:Uncharacterized protein n=1 Tax=Vitis vinifera TaxID=29760 RepID=A0A438DCH7_VITVI|nr:hypothetical protein CK203_117229 [Vitis vinifera]
MTSMMGIPYSGRKLIVDKGVVKASPMPSLKDIEALMVDIDDIEEFNHVCGTYHSSHCCMERFLVKQRIKLELEMLGGFGKVKLVSTLAEQDQTKRNEAPAVDDPVDPNEIEDVDATQRQITDAQSHVSSLIASYNHDMKVLKTCFTSSHYHTDEGQPSSSYEHVNESGAPFDTNNAQHSPVHSGGQRTSFEDGIGCTNEGWSKYPT